MKFSWSTFPHLLTSICAVLAAGLPQLDAAFPPSAEPWLKGIAAVAALVGGVAATLDTSAGLSGQSSGGGVTPPAVQEVK